MTIITFGNFWKFYWGLNIDGSIALHSSNHILLEKQNEKLWLGENSRRISARTHIPKVGGQINCVNLTLPKKRILAEHFLKNLQTIFSFPLFLNFNNFEWELPKLVHVYVSLPY